MNASKVILHLLLSLEALLAIFYFTLEFVIPDGFQVMLVDLFWGVECRELYLASLNEPSDAALVPEVGTAKHKQLVRW